MRRILLRIALLTAAGLGPCLAGCHTGGVRVPETGATLEGTVTYGKVKVPVAMVIPWSGFAMARLVEIASPLASAKYLRMETFLDPSTASGQLQTWYPWPYVEGLTIQEATNELAFLVTGAYGKPVAKSMGAPLRLAIPWKYGFKSIKSITRFTFTDQRPKSFWEALQASEYGFWANINPEVPHPRWSQASEELIGQGGERRPTLLFNGYGEYVAHLYKGLESTERLWA